MSQTPAEKRAYAKGYAAGQKKLLSNTQRGLASLAIREKFERDVFLTALPVVMRGNWQIGGEKVKNAPGYVLIANDFAKEAAKHFGFTPMPDFAPEVEQ